MLKKLLAIAALAFGVTTSAQATYQSAVHITGKDPFSFTLQFAQKENTTIESAQLSLYFADPMDFFGKTNESLFVTVDNVYAGKVSNVGVFGQYYGFDILPALLGDGKLSVSLGFGCTKYSSSACFKQDVWLKDVLFAIQRVPTVPTVPTVPAVPAVPSVPPVPAVPAEPVPATPATPATPDQTLPLPVTPIDPIPSPVPVDMPETPNDTTNPAEVPEPATLLMFGLGLLAVAASRRRA